MAHVTHGPARGCAERVGVGHPEDDHQHLRELDQQHHVTKFAAHDSSILAPSVSYTPPPCNSDMAERSRHYLDAIHVMPRKLPEDHDYLSSPMSLSSSMMGSTTRSTSPDYTAYSSPATIQSLDHVILGSRSRRSSSTTVDSVALPIRTHNRGSTSMDSGFVSMNTDGNSCASRSIRCPSEHGDDAPRSPIAGSFDMRPDFLESDAMMYDDMPIVRRIEDIQDKLETVSLDGSDRTLSATSEAELAEEDSDRSSDMDEVGAVEVDYVLSHILPAIRGVGIQDLSRETLSMCRNATLSFMEIMGAIFDGDISQPASDGNGGSRGQDTRRGSSNDNSGDTPSSSDNNNNKRRGSRKRKSDQSGDGDDKAAREQDGEPGTGSTGSSKRLNSGLRLRCPFRARNPYRFNVRDYHSCAMTYFTTFSDLRAHVAKKHARENPTNFRCQRCNTSFADASELTAHVKQDQACTPRDLDPEDGLDGPTIRHMTDRKRSCGPSEEEQWKDLYNIIFPHDTQVPPYEFTPVIESFEFVKTYLDRLDYFQPYLQDFPLSNHDIETLCERIKLDLIQTMEFSNMKAREMEYSNRNGNKRPSSGATNSLLAWALAISPRDSGVVFDDVSARSSAVFTTGLPLSGTPFSGFGMMPQHRQSFAESVGASPIGRPGSVIFQQPTPQAPFRRPSSRLLQQARHPLGQPRYPTPADPSPYPPPLAEQPRPFTNQALATPLMDNPPFFPMGDLNQIAPDMSNLGEMELVMSSMGHMGPGRGMADSMTSDGAFQSGLIFPMDNSMLEDNTNQGR